jgi:hypothetical protein
MALVPLWLIIDGDTIVPVRFISPVTHAMALAPLWLIIDGDTIVPVRFISPVTHAMALAPLWLIIDGDTIVPVRFISPVTHAVPLVPLWLVIDGEIIVPVRSITQDAIPTPDAKTTNEAAIKAIINDLNMLIMTTSSSNMEILTRVIARPALKPFMRSACASVPAGPFHGRRKVLPDACRQHIGESLKFHPLFGWKFLFLPSSIA